MQGPFACGEVHASCAGASYGGVQTRGRRWPVIEARFEGHGFAEADLERFVLARICPRASSGRWVLLRKTPTERVDDIGACWPEAIGGFVDPFPVAHR